MYSLERSNCRNDVWKAQCITHRLSLVSTTSVRSLCDTLDIFNLLETFYELAMKFETPLI